MDVFVVFVFAYFLVFTVVHAVLLLLAAIEINRYSGRLIGSSLRRTVRSPLAPPISVVVPAYNEAVGIVDSIRALLALEYPTFEIVVVNDGSTDDTAAKVIESFSLHQAPRPTPPFLPYRPVRSVWVPRDRLNLLLVDKENGGKADALNAGISFASYPLVCVIDADSVLEQDALAKTVVPFLDDPVATVASGGIVRVANGCRIDRGRVLEARLPRSGLAMFQVVEYLRSFFSARAGWSAVNGLLIVSGAFGLFRKDAVIAAGGYRTDIVGEDIELIVRLHRYMRDRGRPCRVVYVPDPVCWTEGPETLHALRLQRRRWHRGGLETLLLHWRMLGNPRYRVVGMLSLPALLLFEALGPLVELVGYCVAIASRLTGTIDTRFFLLFFAVALLFGLFLTVGAIALEDASFGRHPGWDDLGRILLFAVLESLGYRQLVHLWRLEGVWQLIRKGEWGAMERKGFSRSEAALQSGVGLR